jgi:anti-sigma28 factor (negative regulator of flagellin synthesis)
VSAYQRMNRLIVECPGLNSSLWAELTAPRGVDRSMNYSTPRRQRAAQRRSTRLTPLSPPSGRDRRAEDRYMNSPLDEPEVREDLVARVRAEIAKGTYDTPEKLEEALDRLADRLESD